MVWWYVTNYYYSSLAVFYLLTEEKGMILALGSAKLYTRPVFHGSGPSSFSSCYHFLHIHHYLLLLLFPFYSTWKCRKWDMGSLYPPALSMASAG